MAPGFQKKDFKKINPTCRSLSSLHHTCQCPIAKSQLHSPVQSQLEEVQVCDYSQVWVTRSHQFNSQPHKLSPESPTHIANCCNIFAPNCLTDIPNLSFPRSLSSSLNHSILYIFPQQFLSESSFCSPNLLALVEAVIICLLSTKQYWLPHNKYNNGTVLHRNLVTGLSPCQRPVVGWTAASQKICPPRTRECDLIWKEGLRRCNYVKDLKISSSWT